MRLELRQELWKAMTKAFDDESIEMFINFGLDRPRNEFRSDVTVLTLAGQIVDSYHRAGEMHVLLDALRRSSKKDNPTLRQILDEIDCAHGQRNDEGSEADYYSAPFVSGKRPFIDRKKLRDFAAELPTGGGPRVLLVAGERPCGKSWTWHYFTFLESMRGEFRAAKVDFAEYSGSPTPFDVMETIGLRLGLGTPTVDRTAMGSGQAKRLVDWFVGTIRQGDSVARATRGFLLVLDSLDHRKLSEDTEDLVEGLVNAALDSGWELSFGLVLMGARLKLLPQEDDRLMRREVIGPLGREDVAAYLKELGDRHGTPLAGDRLAAAVDQSFAGAPENVRLRLDYVRKKVGEFALSQFGPGVAEP